MNKDIQKYIANCALCHREKAKIQNCPLQMMEISDRPFNKISIDLVTECETTAPGKKHILTIIDHLTGWPEAFTILDKSADTVVSTFINKYLPIHMCLRYILSDNETEFKNNLMDQILKQLGIEQIFSAPYHLQRDAILFGVWKGSKLNPSPTIGTYAVILRRPRFWNAELGSPQTHVSHCQEDARWKSFQNSTKDHG